MKNISIVVIATFLFLCACRKEGYLPNSREKISAKYYDAKYNDLTRGDTISVARWKNISTKEVFWKINSEHYKKGDTDFAGINNPAGAYTIDSVSLMTIE
jgi:hypothetical protein